VEFGFEIIEEEGRKGIEYACHRNSKPCVTGLGKPVAFKTRKSAENYISKEVAIRKEEAKISPEEWAARKAEAQRVEAEQQSERDVAFDARLRREREAKEARRERAVLNSALRARGYKWVQVGFRDEEEADAFDLNLPAGQEWQLVAPDNRSVSLSVATQEIGWEK